MLFPCNFCYQPDWIIQNTPKYFAKSKPSRNCLYPRTRLAPHPLFTKIVPQWKEQGKKQSEIKKSTSNSTSNTTTDATTTARRKEEQRQRSTETERRTDQDRKGYTDYLLP